MTISSKVIAGGGKEKVEQWSPPNMRGTEVDISELERDAGPVLTAEQLEQI